MMTVEVLKLGNIDLWPKSPHERVIKEDLFGKVSYA
jgi:hypothetical protein